MSADGVNVKLKSGESLLGHYCSWRFSIRNSLESAGRRGREECRFFDVLDVGRTCPTSFVSCRRVLVFAALHCIHLHLSGSIFRGGNDQHCMMNDDNDDDICISQLTLLICLPFVHGDFLWLPFVPCIFEHCLH